MRKFRLDSICRVTQPVEVRARDPAPAHLIPRSIFHAPEAPALFRSVLETQNLRHLPSHAHGGMRCMSYIDSELVRG